MSYSQILIYTLRFFIPSFFSMLFRAYGLGYKNTKSLIYGFTFFTLYAIFVPSILSYIMGYGQYTHIASIVMSIGGLFVLVFSSDPPGKTIFLHFIQANFIVIFSTILNMFRHIYQFSYTTLLILFLIVSFILFLIAMKYWVKPMRFIAENLHDYVLPLIALPLITLTIVMIIPIYPQQNFSNYPIYCTFMMVLVEIGFFLYIYNLYLNIKKINTLSKEKSKISLLQSEISYYDDFLENAKQDRHDMKHHNLLVLELLANNKIEEAQLHLSQLNDDIENASLTTYCDNTIANSTFRYYESKAKKLNISYSVNAVIPILISTSSTEICSLLSNILENAVNACIQVHENPFINVDIDIDDYNFKIEVTNSTSEIVTFNKSNIPLSKNHLGGIGTRSIISTVEKHKGMVQFFQDNNQFKTRIILPL